jgi:hypothetical protein
MIGLLVFPLNLGISKSEVFAFVVFGSTGVSIPRDTFLKNFIA